MLRVSTRQDEVGVTLKVEGKLAGPWVEEFRTRWAADSVTYKDRPLVVDLTDLTFIDAEGTGLLRTIYQAGSKLVGCGLMVRSLIEEITGAAGGDRQSKAGGLLSLSK